MAFPYIGQIILVAFDFAPAGWAKCDGSLLPIAENESLFFLIGTTYGGDGESTFAVPDLRGRLAVGMGTGPGLSTMFIGEASGFEDVTLTTNQLPSHLHALTGQPTASLACKNGPGNSRSPVGNVPAIEAAGSTMLFSSGTPDSNMSSAAIPAVIANSGATGSATPHTNMQPFLTLNYCISLFGEYPSQS